MSILSPKSFDGTDISQASSDYRAKFPRDGAALTPARQLQRVVRVAGFWPRALDPQPQERQFALSVIVPAVASDAALQAVKTLFSPAKGERTLVATDGTLDWQMECSVVSVDHIAGLLTAFRVTVQASYGLWKRTTDSTGSVAISAAVTATLNLPTVGNERSPVVIEATPTAVKGTASDQRYRRQHIAAWRAARGASDYPYFIQLDTATEVTATRMLASGNDLIVIVDGQVVDRWLGNMNAATTNIAIVLDFSPARSAALRAAITASVPATGGSLAVLDGSQLPSSGVLEIGSEAIAWTSKSPDGDTLLGITRSVRATTAAIHALGDIGYLVEHQIDVCWGYTAAAAPVTDDRRKPIIELTVADSDNTKWTHEYFATKAGTRSAEWVPTLLGTNGGMIAIRGSYGGETYYVPAADTGTYNDATAQGAAARWQCVDDAPLTIPVGDTDYIKFGTPNGLKQTFPVSLTAPPDGSMASVHVFSLARSVQINDPARYSCALVINGVLWLGAIYGIGLLNLNTNYFIREWFFDADPSSGVAWSAAGVAAITEFGYEIVDSNDYETRVTQLYLGIKTVNEADPAAGIGMFYAPGGSFQGHDNADAWALATPCGVAGVASIVASAHAGITIANGISLFGVDERGKTTVVWKGSTATDTDVTLTVTPNGPLYVVGLWSPYAGTVAFTGFSVNKTVLKFDPAQTPLVAMPAREDVYIHRWSVTNPATGQAISVLFPSALSKKLTIDADTGDVSYELAGYNPLPGLTLDVPRLAWLEVAAGANALAFSDPTHGSGVLALTARCRDRRS